ncbi:MAG: DUF4492 domain-containing protein [Rikenellaceae bacterium]|nr:DUF4492 domain-containing protein [Rikenellaceae bacterium]
MKDKNVVYRIWVFYRDGFRSMTLGRTLWMLILIKLFIMFAVLRLFFFPRQLAGLSDEEKSIQVMENLLQAGPFDSPLHVQPVNLLP